MDRCRVVSLGGEFVNKNADKYDGTLVQVLEFLYESDESEDVAVLDGNAGACKGILIKLLLDQDNSTKHVIKIILNIE